MAAPGQGETGLIDSLRILVPKWVQAPFLGWCFLRALNILVSVSDFFRNQYINNRKNRKPSNQYINFCDKNINILVRHFMTILEASTL